MRAGQLFGTRLKQMIWRLLRVLLGLIVVLCLVSFLLPAEQRVERALVIEEPAERIWALIENPPAWNLWSPWYARDPEMKITYEGAPRGQGARWRWESDEMGSGNMQIVRADEPRELNYAVAFDGMGSARGRFVLEPADGGTRVVWSFVSDAGYNPIARWFGLMLDNWVGPDLQAGLANMQQTLSNKDSGKQNGNAGSS